MSSHALQALEQDFIKYGLVEAIMEPLAKVKLACQPFLALMQSAVQLAVSRAVGNYSWDMENCRA